MEEYIQKNQQARLWWHSLTGTEVSRILNVNSETGLSSEEAALRQKSFGENKLANEPPLSRFTIFLEQFKSPLMYILVIAGIVTLFLKELGDSIVIFAAVLLNAIVGFFQENKALKTLSALKKIVNHKAEVLRGDNLKIINSEQVVPGDVVILNPGDRVPADGRLISTQDLEINEMALTGEWLAAKKNASPLPEETPLPDRDNMAYMGTVVENGKGCFVVTEIGINTEIGKLAMMVKQAKEEKTPYQKRLLRFSKAIGIIVGCISLAIFVLGIINNKPFVEMLTISVAVAVAAIPEGLPVAVTVILALGMDKILKKKGLVRKLSSAETLGSTSIIVTDKTGTLTQGSMKVEQVISDDIINTLKICAFTSEAFVESPKDPSKELVLRGRPTDKALLEAALKAGINPSDFANKKIAELPFDNSRKFIASLYKQGDSYFLYVCGAPENVIDVCGLTQKQKESLKDELEGLTSKGLRVVASASKEVSLKVNRDEHIDIKKMLKGLVFAGFITLRDPIREDVKQAMKICRNAGMRPIIATGDHKLTAIAVAEELGFKIKKENILQGNELENLSDKEFEAILPTIKIYARVEPKHKLRIIQAWQDSGEVVAMTGDGVNDAPALKKADIGVALGSGTEVARQTSDLILLNDSFSIIVSAIEQGRAILDNIRKVITYLFTGVFTEIILIGGTMALAWLTHQPWILPIAAVQILWVNLIEDGPISVSLAFEEKEKDLMKQPPINKKTALLTKEMKIIIFIVGLVTDLILLALFLWLWHKTHDIRYVQTMIFAGLSIDSLFYVFSCKSLRKNIWNISLLSNKFLLAALSFSLFMLFIAIYAPPLQGLLKTMPLSLSDWVIIFGLGIIGVVLIEAVKYYFIINNKE